MNPIFKKKTVISVDCSDLADFIKEKYGQDPEIEASLELNDDDTFEIKANASEADEDAFNKWKANRQIEYSEIWMLMDKLAKDGHIEDGTYLIKTY